MDEMQARALAGGLQKFQPARSLQTIRSDQNGGSATVFKLVSTTANANNNFEYRAVIESDALGMFFSAYKPGKGVGEKSQQPIQYTLANSYCVYRANLSLLPALIPLLNLGGNTFVQYEHSLIALKGGTTAFADPQFDPFQGGQAATGSVNLVTAPNRTEQLQMPMRGGPLHAIICDEVLGRLSIRVEGPLAAGADPLALPKQVALQGTTAIFWISQSGAVY